MRTRHVFALALLVALGAAAATAAPFEPVFQLMEMTGSCQVSRPDAPGFTEAESGKAYPYGTTVRTDRRSSVLVVFSAGNQCRVLAGTTVTIAENADDPSQKTLILQDGKINVDLEETFHESNSLNVETPTAICGAIGCTFTVEVKLEADLKITVVVCENGEIKLFHNDYEIPLMDAGDYVSVAASHDMSFIRIKNIKGAFDLTFTDDTGNPRTVSMDPEGVVKIWRRLSEDGSTMVMTILLVGPDGTLIEAINFSVPVAPQPPAGVEGEGEGEGGQEPGQEPTEVDEDFQVVLDLEDGSTTSTSTTTTTSTTPSFTPVGPR